MQFCVYRNRAGSALYPLLLDVQADIIETIDSRVVIPLTPVDEYGGKIVTRLNPVLQVEGIDYLLMTNELAGVSISTLGEEICSLDARRDTIKASLDFVFDGF